MGLFDQQATVTLKYAATGLNTLSQAGMAIAGLNQGLEIVKKGWNTAENAARTFTHAIEGIVKSSPRLGEITNIIKALGDRWTQFKRLVADSGVFDTVKDIFAAILLTVDDLFKSGKAERAAKTVGQVLSDLMKDTAIILIDIAEKIYAMAQDVHQWVVGKDGKGSLGQAVRSGAGWATTGAVVGGVVGGVLTGGAGAVPGAKAGALAGGVLGASRPGQQAWNWLGHAAWDVESFFGMHQNAGVGGGGGGGGLAGPSPLWALKQRIMAGGNAEQLGLLAGGGGKPGMSSSDLYAALSAAFGSTERFNAGKFSGGEDLAAEEESQREKAAEVAEKWADYERTLKESLVEEERARKEKMLTMWSQYYDRLVMMSSKWKKLEDINLKDIVKIAKIAAIENLRSWLDAKGKQFGIQALEEAAAAIGSAASGNWHAAAMHGLAAVKYGALSTATGVASGMLMGSTMEKASSGGGSSYSSAAEASDTTTGTRIVSGSTGVTTQTLNLTNNFVFNDMVVGGETGIRELVYTWIIPALDDAMAIRATGSQA